MSTSAQEYPNCFGCGEANAIGLRLKYRWEGTLLVTEFTPDEAHQGWHGIVHGGIIATLLYEVMENFPYRSDGAVAMMRGMQTHFRKPAKTGKRIRAVAWLDGADGRNMRLLARLTQCQDGALIAEGSADVVLLREDHIQRLGIAT